MQTSASNTISSALAAAGCLEHALVRVELTNGLLLTGRIVRVDAATMNMMLDALIDTSVIRRDVAERGSAPEFEVSPAPLRCCNSVVVRGCHVRYIDFINEEADGGRSLDELVTVLGGVRPSLI
ncbi:LSM domain [Trypanosoma vivax]|uniref:Uncharacterized protein n=1 Tax=Trypanosoma vivax (strain Y486) TaxID=1055687 RepID=G0U1B2_TRYVY|nr:hypothetical protein TRVL_01587 [Trypanosoma vivax]KAH8609168.1 LSM domain [Trypanosoma vivax]CCC49867.1 conserved hypothetical protein [Trypanosoma vivax Y486]